MPYVVPQRTGFLELSAELQLEILNLLKPLVPPEPLTDLSRDAHRIWADGMVRALRIFAPRDVRVNQEAASSLLLLNKATFESLAPHYYQNSVVYFYDASVFHRELLVNATDACLYNLRYVGCVLNARNDWVKGRTISWVQALIKEWPELANLVRFEVIFCLDVEFVHTKLFSRRTLSPSERDLEGQWSYIDWKMGGEFTGLERRALSTSLRGFRVVHGLKPVNIASWYGLEHLSLTFTKVD